MKIPSAIQVQTLDQYTIKNEPIASIDLMERASERFTHWLLKKVLRAQDSFSSIIIFVGLGNNGGDGLAIARLLKKQGFNPHTFVVKFSSKSSEDFAINLNRLKEVGKVSEIHAKKDLPNIPDNSLIIDAIFGSGLSRKITGIAAETIKHIQKSNSTVVAVDIPSGIYCDAINTDKIKVIADEVLSFQFPKAAFLMKENESYIKSWDIAGIGLHQKGVEEIKVNKYFTDISEVKSWLRPRSKFSHKGTYGYLLVMAGSKGKIGAAQLTLKAALKSGTGLLTAYVPSCGYEIVQLAVPEAMCLTDPNEEMLSKVPDISNYKAIAIGPGIGTNELTTHMLNSLLNQLNNPAVFDADAINIMARNPRLLKAIPKESIFTPHPKEFERLVGKCEDTPQQWEKLTAFAKENSIVTILKGAYTAVADTAGNIYFNSTGNSGMATGGSGDVLTGIIAGLLVTGYSPLQAARMGVFIHGLAGDLAAKTIGQVSLSAGDIVNYLGQAFLTLEE